MNKKEMQKCIKKLEDDLSVLKTQMKSIHKYYSDEFWKLHHPFEFEVGDFVQFIQGEHPKDVYKVIDRIYDMVSEPFYRKQYELFDCINNRKQTANEDQIQLYQKGE